MRLLLVVPSVLAHPRETLARSPVLARLAARSQVAAAPDLDSALVRALGVDLPIGPLAALGAGLDAGTRWIARADPVSVSIGHDDVRIRSRVDDLDASERDTLSSLLSSHFAADGVAFVAARSDAWFAISERAFDVAATPLDAALEQPLRALLPTGADAPRWRRWLTEAQMLLHEHPLAERTGAPVNAVWLSHPGTLPAAPRVPVMRIHAGDARPGDLARGLARLAQREVHAVSVEHAIAAREDALVVVDAVRNPQALGSALERDMAPALAALDAKRIDTLDVALDGAGRAGLWRAKRGGWLQRIASRDAPFDPDALGSRA